MKYKKIMFMLVLAIFIFGAASVCASDVNDTLIANEDDSSVELSAESNDGNVNILEENDNVALKSTNNQTLLTDGETGSLVELNHEINDNDNTTITLTKNYKYVTGDEAFQFGMDINRTLTINGNGHTIDGSGTASIFKINADHVTITNLTFKNCKTYSALDENGRPTENTVPRYEFNGGAIKWEGNYGTITQCTFTENYAVQSGGAIKWSGDYGTVKLCNFKNNTAEYFFSGAIDLMGSNATVTQSNFTGNKALNSQAGAINFNDYSNVSHCIFINNTASSNGGAISIGESNNVSYCIFIGNKARWGGAINMYSDSIIAHSIFANNIAEFDGGALLINDPNVLVINSTFAGNSANRGGAIYGYDNDYTKAILSIFDSNINETFDYFTIAPAYLNVNDFTTSYNSGEKLLLNLTADNVNYDGYNITIKIYNQTDDLVRTFHALSGDEWIPDLPVGYYHASFDSEYAGFQQINRTITITAPEHTFWFLNYTINGNDNPVIELSHDFYFDPAYDAAFVNGIVINRPVTIKGNGNAIDANRQARIFYVQSANAVLENLTLKNAHSNSEGGAVYFNINGDVTNCNFTGNSAYRGGAVYFLIQGTVTNCNFTDNTASLRGGAVYFSDNGDVTNCNFTDNDAYDGGAVYFNGNGDVTNCNFTNNTANDDGGGAVYFNGNGDVTNCNFAGNTAYRGGAVYFLDTGNVTNCNFTNNVASEDGGAVYFSYNGNVTNCNFTNNSAKYGGAILFVSTGTVTNCNFTNNTGTYYGGAVYFSYKGNVTNCNFADNSAYYGGGAILFVSTGSVSNCNFTGNNATTGSAIYFYSTSATKTVSNSIFLNNRANAEALDVVKNDNNITITFTGKNNLLNAIYSAADVTFTNVTYWGANGIANTGSSPTTPSRSNRAAGQNITVGVVVNGNLVLSDVMVTDENGTIVLNINAGENYYIGTRHNEDSYYTEAEKTISNNTKFNVNVTSQTTTNKTVNITAKSNIYSRVMPGKLLFIVPNTNPINATYAGNGTWWALYTFDGAGDYNVNASYIGLDNVTINNATIAIRYDASVDVNNKTLDLLIDDTFTIVATTAPEGLNVTFVPDDSGVYSVDEYGKVTALRDGEGSILIKVKGNAGFAENSTIVNVTVSKIPTEISVLNDTLNLAVGDEIAAGATLKPGDAGNLTYISDEESVAKVKDGKIMAVGNGTVVITVSFGGSESYAAAENKTISVTVSCIPTHITVENVTSHPGDDVNITVKVAADDGIPFNGNINFTLPDSNAVPVKIVNGTGVVSWTVPENYEGKYPTKAIFDGNMRYLSSGAEGSIAVSKYGSKVTISPIANVDYGNNVTIKYNIENRTTVNVTIDGVADDRIIIRDDSITVIVPDAGNYSITIINRQNNLYESSNDTGSFAVSKVKSGLDVNGTSVYFGEDAVLNYTLTDAENINVSITDWSGKTLTEGVDYNITITGAQIIIGVFDDGAYTVSVTTVVDSNHIPASENVTVSINPISDLEVILAPMNQTVNYGDVINWTAKIVNNGPNYALKSYFDVYASEGLVFTNPSVHAYLNHYRVNVPFQLAPGSYFTILIDAMVNASNTDLTLNVSVGDEYCPDPNPANNNASATVKVEYANASINISVESEITAGDDLTVNVELPDDAFGNVTVSVGDKNYTQEVNGGKATITVPGMGAGENTITVSYSGDKKYAPTEKTVNVTVKKATAKLTAKAKTFKDTDKTKKYTVTLKDNKGKPIVDATVTLKVNGKTYSAKTNSKGQATFKLTKLTKTGTYTAIIRYAGDKNHTGASVKAKITVKSTWKTIAKGSNYHSMVKKIQIALKSKGYYIAYNGHQLMVDGIFDIYTENAVKQFQRANGLKVTGKVNLATAKKLGIVK